jgi:hypothetical protein
VKYSFITQHKNTYPISLQCHVLGVSRQCYYHWCRHTENKPVDPEHEEMLEWVKAIAKASDETLRESSHEEGHELPGLPDQSKQGEKTNERSRCAGTPEKEIQGDYQQQSPTTGVR